MDDTLPFLKEGACKFSKFKFSKIHKWVSGKLTKYHIMQFTFTVHTVVKLNIINVCGIQYSILYSIQYSILYSIQYSILYSILYSMQYSILYTVGIFFLQNNTHYPNKQFLSLLKRQCHTIL